MANLYAKNFNDADEVKNPPKAKVEIIKLSQISFERRGHRAGSEI